MYPVYFEQSFQILLSWLLKMLKRKGLYFKNIGLFLGWSITKDQLEEVAELSGVLADNDDYLPADFRAKCEQAMPDPLELDVGDFANIFRFPKENVDLDT